jgi:hypothetical protein
MSLEGDIRTALLAMSAVTAYTGSNTTTARIRPYKLDPTDDPTEEHIVIEVDSKNDENDLEGEGGLPLCEVNISCRAMTRTLVNALAEAVRVNGTDPGTGLAGYGGASTAFHSWLVGRTETTLRWDDKSGRKWHSVEMDFRMQYSETV